MHCDRGDGDLKRTIRENYGTGLERLQPRMEVNSYNSVIKQLQFIVKNYTCRKKQIQETMKESKMANNTNTHAYMQAGVNVMFMQMHAKKGIKMFFERYIVAMIKEFKQLY